MVKNRAIPYVWWACVKKGSIITFGGRVFKVTGFKGDKPIVREHSL